VSARAEAIVTAGLRPERFAGRGVLANSRTLVFITLAILVLTGFGFRVAGLSAEGLSEDELNKLNAVADYRAHGLTGANGEHPMLMKALQATSIILSEKWNGLVGPENRIAPETALRLPGAIAGALSAILIYLIAAELFGVEVALIAAALWSFDPSGIGFARVRRKIRFCSSSFCWQTCFGCAGNASRKAPIGIRIVTTGPPRRVTARWSLRSTSRT
jgi:hypothetical protein